MAETNSPRGLVLDLITPLKRSGDIDGRSLGRHLDRVLPHVQAMLIAGPLAGEGKDLDDDRRKELLDKVLVVVRGRAPVLVWISRETEEKTLKTLLLLEKTVETRKYDGPVFWVDSPLYYHSNRGLPDLYRSRLTGPGRTILLYNDPDLIRERARPLKRNNIRTAILKEISSIEMLGGLIYRGSLDRANNYQKAVRARADFRIYDGDESRFLRYPSLSGVVSVGANLAPKAWSRITASSINRNDGADAYPDHLQQIWETGDYLRNLMTLYQPGAVPLIKRILFEMGILESPTCVGEVEEMGEAVNPLRTLLKEFGDYAS